MLPSFVPNYAVYGSFVHAEFFGDFDLGFTCSDTLSDANHLFFGELASWLSEFACHVIHVFGLRTQKEMSRIAAMTIVALVADDHALWDRAVVQFVAESVWESRAARVVEITSAFGGSIFPLPAFIRIAFCNACPKAIFQRTLWQWWQRPEYGMVSVNKSFRMMLKPSDLFPSSKRKGGVIAAPTLALAVRLQQSVLPYPRRIIVYVFGKRWGNMRLHENLLFSCQAWDAANVARHFLLLTYRSILARMSNSGNEVIGFVEWYLEAK